MVSQVLLFKCDEICVDMLVYLFETQRTTYSRNAFISHLVTRTLCGAYVTPHAFQSTYIIFLLCLVFPIDQVHGFVFITFVLALLRDSYLLV